MQKGKAFFFAISLISLYLCHLKTTGYDAKTETVIRYRAAVGGGNDLPAVPAAHTTDVPYG